MSEATEGQAPFLENLAQKYEETMLNLEEKGVPSPRILLPLILLIAIIASIYFLLPASFQSSKEITLLVTNENQDPVPSIRVDLFADGATKGTSKTDQDGKVSFSDVPKNAILSLKITDENKVYSDFNEEITLDATSIILKTAPAPKLQLFNVLIKNSIGSPILDANVRVAFDDGTYLDKSTDYMGEAVFQLDEKITHLTIKASASSYVSDELSVNRAQILLGTAVLPLNSIDEEKNQDKDKEVKEKFGEIKLFLQSDSNDELESIMVVLKDANTMAAIKNGRSDSTGEVLFENVQLGFEYFIEVKESSKYLGSVSDVFELSSSGDILESFVTLEEKSSGDYIDVEVSGKTGYISGAKIILFSLDGSSQLSALSTNDKGRANFLVLAGKEYHLTVYSDGYLPYAFDASSGTQLQTVELSEQTEENSVNLKVAVSQDGEPAYGAKIGLYYSDGFFVGIPLATTDLEGIADFKLPREINGETKPLLVKAFLDQSSAISGTFYADANEEIELELIPKPAAVSVSLIDAISKVTLQKGTVSAISSDGKILSTCSITANICDLKIPANSEISFAAVSEGYLQTSSEAQIFEPGESAKISLHLISQKDSSGISASFLGVFDKTEVKELGNAQTYTAKFLATFPTALDVSGFHLHLTQDGSAVTIESVDSSFQSLFASSKFTQDDCYSLDAGNESITSIDVLFPKGAIGSKEIAVKIKVPANAKANSQLVFNYKAYSKKADVALSFPSDEQFKVSESTAPFELVEGMCQKKNAIKSIKVTSAPLICNQDASFCKKIIFDSAIKDDIALGSEFSIKFEALSNLDINSISLLNGNLQLLSADSGSNLADETPAAKDQTFQVSIPANVKTSGSIKMKALKAGTTDLHLQFKSEEITYDYHRNVKISGQNLMKVTFAPNSLLSGEQKNIRVLALDAYGVPITDAAVTLFECEKSPLDFQEPQTQGSDERNAGKDGVYSIPIFPSSIGEIGVRVEHPNYKTYSQCGIAVNINDDSLKISPSSLQFAGDSSSIEAKTVSITSTHPTKGMLSIISNCQNQDSPVVYAFPNSIDNFKASASVQLGILEKSTAKTNCNLIFEQQITPKQFIRKAIPIRIDVKSPDVISIGDPTLPVIPPTIYVKLDENGLFDAFYSPVAGDVSYCDIKAPEDFNVNVECTKNIIHISADYSSEKIFNSLRKRGTLMLRSADQFVKMYSIIVTAPDHPSPDAIPPINYYENLAPIPNPIVIQVDPYTRKSEFIYSLSPFSEPVTGCNLQGLDFGITTEYCSAEEQRIRVFADFSGNDIYNRLLDRIFGMNPACEAYYRRTASFSNPLGYPGLNEFGNGYYPVPEYQNGYMNYLDYPQMNSLQPPMIYPPSQFQYSNYQQNSLLYPPSSYSVDPRYSATACDSGFIEGSILFRMKSGKSQTVPVRIVARGDRRTVQKPFGNALKNSVLNDVDIVLDPFTNSRFISFTQAENSKTEPLCNVYGDPEFFSAFKISLNSKDASFNPFAIPNAGSLVKAITPFNSLCKLSGSSLQISFDAKADASLFNRKSLTSQDGNLYIRRYYSSANVVSLLPLKLQLGSKNEFDNEPIISGKPLQFVITNNDDDAKAAFKHTSDYLEEECKVNGFDGFALFGDQSSTVTLDLGKLEMKNYVLATDDKGAKSFKEAAKDDKTAFEMAVPLEDASFSCKGMKGTVSADISVASFKDGYEIALVDPKQDLKSQIPFLGGGIVAPEETSELAKKYGCKVSSDQFDAAFSLSGKDASEKEKYYACEFDENGLFLTTNYAVAFANAGNTPSTEFKHNFAIELLSITEYKKPIGKLKQIARKLAKFDLVVKNGGTILEVKQLPAGTSGKTSSMLDEEKAKDAATATPIKQPDASPLIPKKIFKINACRIQTGAVFGGLDFYLKFENVDQIAPKTTYYITTNSLAKNGAPSTEIILEKLIYVENRIQGYANSLDYLKRDGKLPPSYCWYNCKNDWIIDADKFKVILKDYTNNVIISETDCT